MKTRVRAHVMTQNCASAKPAWRVRSLVLRVRVWTCRPDVLLCTELYATKRARFSKLITAVYVEAGHHYGKVIYVHKHSKWRPSSSAASMLRLSLGNGKHAIAARLTHRDHPATHLVVVAAHLSWQKRRQTARAQQSERLIGRVERHYGRRVPAVYGGDFNVGLHSKRTDTVGRVFARRGLDESYKHATHRSNTRFNSANQYWKPAPQHSIHLDRFFGRGVTFYQWYLDAYTGRYGSDHWGVGTRLYVPINPTGKA